METTRVWRIGVLPVFCITVTLSRTEYGAQVGFALQLYKLGLHFYMSLMD